MQVRIAGDGWAMAAELRRQPADLVILDIMLPGEDGLTLCRRLRAETTMPIIMLTAMGDETDRIVGLEIGADDYITKPFSAREVLARVRGLLRRATYAPGTHAPRPLFFEGWKIDPIRRQVLSPDNARVTMTTPEFDLLLAFCHNPGRILTREELLSLSHTGLAGPVERTVDVHVSRLRQKVEADPKEPRLVMTVRLGGYVFTPEVTEA
ncbi:DNA-binding response regulator [Frigidibacter albus]|nr:response regulator transcription factor [Frigidibacter albus]GGH53232.1 DNA-binding response regulator [Frigidibacter albus]